MSDTTQLTLANEVFARLMAEGNQHEASTRLVAGAAFQVGFARIAVGSALWSREPHGHEEMQARLSNEQFDVLMLAPVDAAARTAVTCIDLCAAAAYRLAGGIVSSSGRESDVRHLLGKVERQNIILPASQAVWLRDLADSAEWQLLEKVRNAVTHRAIQSISEVGTNPPVTSLVIDDVKYDNVELSQRCASFAEMQFLAFVVAVLTDFPTT
jgi:hypothetical protein